MYLGVPYAAPPVGVRRLAPPAPPPYWPGLRDATSFGHRCVQANSPMARLPNCDGSPPTQSEDCLTLNVYVPVPTPHGAAPPPPRPVMVWIHGGSYARGAGSLYDATSLAAKGVVVVTINYRLDALGFLSTEDDVIPGNYGMLDQVAALQWVQRNVAAFNGDPKLVTVFGESAGASSVSLLLLSPMCEGLFQRAIMESGSSLSPWAVQFPQTKLSLKQAALLIAQGLNCSDTSDSNAILSCIRSADSATLINITNIVKLNNDCTIIRPRIDSNQGLLPESPLKILYNGKINQVDTLRGYNNDEYGYFIADSKYNNSVFTPELVYGFLEACTSWFKDNKPIVEMLHKKYINGTTSEELRQELVNAITDLWFVGALITEIETASYNPITLSSRHFMYNFQPRPNGAHTPTWMKAVHADEMAFVFNVSAK